MSRSRSINQLSSPSDLRIGVLSYCDHIRTLAPINHQEYCNKHGYTYIFNIAPLSTTSYFQKIEVILNHLNLFDYVFWIDDDAFFTDFSLPLDDFLKDRRSLDFLFCSSPINNGQWTYISSGNFFIKNGAESREVLQYALQLDLHTVKSWWRDEKYGFFTNGDQDAIVYSLEHVSNNHEILPYTAFNCRPFHYSENIDEHFIVHFTGDAKRQQIIKFANKFDLSEALVPENELRDRPLNEFFRKLRETDIALPRKETNPISRFLSLRRKK